MKELRTFQFYIFLSKLHLEKHRTDFTDNIDIEAHVNTDT